MRCSELGLCLGDLDLIAIGMIFDMWIERGNDSCEYEQIATQEDFDNF